MAHTSLETTELIVRTLGEVALENRNYFAELDGVVGDGDFGISLATGFEAVTITKWDSLNRTNPGTFLRRSADVYGERWRIRVAFGVLFCERGLKRVINRT
jgi:hypothetical protein